MTDPAIWKNLQDSARAFQAAWPILGPALGGGRLVPVEALSDDLPRLMDCACGIDYLLVTSSRQILALSTRVQFGRPWRSFSLGSEQLMRLRSALASLGDPIHPSSLVQVYVEGRDSGRPLYAASTNVREALIFVEEHSRLVEVRYSPGNSNAFHVIWVKDLLDAGIEVKEFIASNTAVRSRAEWIVTWGGMRFALPIQFS